MSLESFYHWIEPGANGVASAPVSAVPRVQPPPPTAPLIPQQQQQQHQQREHRAERNNGAPFVDPLLHRSRRPPRPQQQQQPPHQPPPQQPPPQMQLPLPPIAVNAGGGSAQLIGISPPRHPYQPQPHYEPRSRATLPNQPHRRERSAGPVSSRSAHSLSRQSAAGINVLLRPAPADYKASQPESAMALASDEQQQEEPEIDAPITLLRSVSEGLEQAVFTPAVQFHAFRGPPPEPEPRFIRFHHVPKSATATLRSHSANRRPAGRTLRAQKSDESSLGTTAGGSRFSAVVEPRLHVLPRAGASVSLLKTGR